MSSEALSLFFQNPEALIQPSGGNIDFLLSDLKLEDYDELQDLGISGIVYRDENHSIVISKQTRVKFISYLKGKLGVENDAITWEFRRIEWLYSTPSYCALSAGARHDSICRCVRQSIAFCNICATIQFFMT